MKRHDSMASVAWRRFAELGSSEDGAALVMTLAMFFFMYVVVLSVHAVSTAVRERIHLQNAVDAAAYSAAVVQADTFSRVATINRAMAWTYVQMTRRQMDYIVFKWLDRTIGHYRSDQSEASKWNKNNIDPCGGHHSPCSGWFIGANGDLSTYGQVQLNGLNSTLVSSFLSEIPNVDGLSNLFNLGGKFNVDALSAELLAAIGIAEAKNLSSGNALAVEAAVEAGKVIGECKWMPSCAEDADTFAVDSETLSSLTSLASSLSSDSGHVAGSGIALTAAKAQIIADRISIAAMNLYSRKLVREMPSQIDTAVKGILQANVPAAMLDDCRFMISQNRHPLENERLQDSLGAVAKGYFGNLRNTKEDEERFLAFAGYDDTLIETFMKGSGLLDNMIAGGFDQWFVRGDGQRRTDGALGLQRSYKHWAEGPLSGEHAAYNPYLPTCWNTRNLRNSPPSIALYSEWQWWSEAWFCIRTIFGTIHIHLPYCHGLVNNGCKFSSGPGGKDLLAFVTAKLKALAHLGDIVKFYTQAPLGVRSGDTIESVSSEGCPITSYKDGCRVALEEPPNGDRSPLPFTCFARLYADDPHLYNACYVGECAKPLIMRRNYFGEAGTISVGLVRRNENVWSRLVGAIEGIFTAFDPAVSWSWVFASAKAGYHDPDASGQDGCYIVDARGDKGSGGSWWNFCQDDWDAVFVPVRQANGTAVSRVWVPGGDKLISDWISKGNWVALGASDFGDEAWEQIPAPPGMGGTGNLEWEEMKNEFFH